MADENSLSLPEIEPTTRVLAMPTDTNAAGDIFGGWIMSQVDIAGSIAAHRHAGGRAVTVAVNAMQFKKPVYVADLVSFYAEVQKVGNTSMTVFVEVFAERNRQQHEVVKVTEATLTFVAIDDDGRPRAVKAPA
ncbi:MAG TPA: acyl-CoA thioesterase [Gammaproteobacteria bacterium]|nr:acyl-CoA thioesterase [Gammaproteobacteria bacterium]